MRVFLTGATGFLGSHLARRLLAEGCRVTALVRPDADLTRLRETADRLELFPGDLFSRESLRDALRAGPYDLCMHLAWYAEPGKWMVSPRHVDYLDATMRLLQEALDAGCPRFLFCGSCIEYGTRAGYVDEKGGVAPDTLYGAAKHAVYLMGEPLARSRGASFVAARVFNIFGPREDPRRLMPAVIRALLNGEEVALTHGEQIRDYLHAEDVAEALWRVAESEVEGAVNVGSGNPVSVRSVAATLGEILGRGELLRFGTRPMPPGESPFLCADPRRLHDEVGWKPRLTLREGLEQTIDWWRAQGGTAEGAPHA